MIELGPLAAPHGNALADLLEDDEVIVRAAASRALIAAGPNVYKSIPAIKRRLHSERPEVRRAAVSALRGLASQGHRFAHCVGKLLHEEGETGAEALRLEETSLRSLVAHSRMSGHTC